MAKKVRQYVSINRTTANEREYLLSTGSKASMTVRARNLDGAERKLRAKGALPTDADDIDASFDDIVDAEEVTVQIPGSAATGSVTLPGHKVGEYLAGEPITENVIADAVTQINAVVASAALDRANGVAAS